MPDDLRIALRIRARDETQPAVRSARRGIAAAGVEIERLEARFRAATGSASAARAELEFTRSEARRLGIDFRAAADAYSGFAAAARRAGGTQRRHCCGATMNHTRTRPTAASIRFHGHGAPIAPTRQIEAGTISMKASNNCGTSAIVARAPTESSRD